MWIPAPTDVKFLCCVRPHVTQNAIVNSEDSLRPIAEKPYIGMEQRVQQWSGHLPGSFGFRCCLPANESKMIGCNQSIGGHHSSTGQCELEVIHSWRSHSTPQGSDFILLICMFDSKQLRLNYPEFTPGYGKEFEVYTFRPLGRFFIFLRGMTSPLSGKNLSSRQHRM